MKACADPVEAFANFRRIRIPRVHGVQRLSLANNRFKHLGNAADQKKSMAAGGGFLLCQFAQCAQLGMVGEGAEHGR